MRLSLNLSFPGQASVSGHDHSRLHDYSHTLPQTNCYADACDPNVGPRALMEGSLLTERLPSFVLGCNQATDATVNADSDFSPFPLLLLPVLLPLHLCHSWRPIQVPPPALCPWFPCSLHCAQIPSTLVMITWQPPGEKKRKRLPSVP